MEMCPWLYREGEEGSELEAAEAHETESVSPPTDDLLLFFFFTVFKAVKIPARFILGARHDDGLMNFSTRQIMFYVFLIVNKFQLKTGKV